MIDKFKLTQLYRTGTNDIGGSVEYKPEYKTDCKIQMNNESKEGLWIWVNEDWETEKTATVVFDGFQSDGDLINPVITHIELLK